MKRAKKWVLTLIACTMFINSVVSCAREYSYKTTKAQRDSIANDWTYYKRGYSDYNCLAYAMGNNTKWYWPWGSKNPTVKQTKDWLKSKCKYKIADKNKKSGLDKFVICVYTNNSGRVTHFSRTTKLNGKSLGNKIACVSKWGRCELFTHKTRNPYKKNGIYGELSFIAHRNTQTCESKCPTA